MSFGALTEMVLPLSALIELTFDPGGTSSVRTFGCRKEASPMIRRGVPCSSSWM
jgi:hypothetical protein